MEETIDPERQRLAREYARISRRMMLLDLALSGLYVLAWLVFGWSAALKAVLLGWTANEWLLVAGFGLVFGGIYLLLNLPLAYFEGFALPHRYGQSNQTLLGWVRDQVTEALLSGILGLVVLEVIYAALRAFPDTWCLWAAGFLLLFSVLLANLAPVLLMPLFNKFEPLGDEHAELVARLTRLVEGTGASVRGVFKFDMSKRTKAANAALAGLGSSRRIILGDTLLKEFSLDEIETVLAHELGHHVNRDIPTGILIQGAVTLAGLWLASLGLKAGVVALGFQGVGDIAALPLFLLVMGAYGLLTMPLINTYSRWREHRADEYALQLTHKGEAYASALTRLANQNLSEAEPEPWIEFLLYSHPSLGKRIRHARRGSAV